MPRFLSAVTILSSSLPTVLTQTCRTFFLSGASHARRRPSGESRGWARSGFPNRTSREMRGGSWAGRGRAGSRNASATAARANLERRFLGMKTVSSSPHYVEWPLHVFSLLDREEPSKSRGVLLGKSGTAREASDMGKLLKILAALVVLAGAAT